MGETLWMPFGRQETTRLQLSLVSKNFPLVSCTSQALYHGYHRGTTNGKHSSNLTFYLLLLPLLTPKPPKQPWAWQPYTISTRKTKRLLLTQTSRPDNSLVSMEYTSSTILIVLALYDGHHLKISRVGTQWQGIRARIDPQKSTNPWNKRKR